MDLVNKTGGFTVPELARALKVSPSSLYNHVAGREQIVELLRERAMSDVALPADDSARPWTDVVADIMRSYRQSYARYPRLIPLLTSHAVNSDHALTMYNTLAVAFGRAGFDPRTRCAPSRSSTRSCWARRSMSQHPTSRGRRAPRSDRSSRRRWPPAAPNPNVPMTPSNSASRCCCAAWRRSRFPGDRAE